ncbi:hypothetical protein CJF32_00000305 [Rutstroemia sp. NJR-2017a WRK4]|nr:hypothetical protein CJF32_00000305 [Rutstroemia sp. NJR-2017a WRK4]
MPNRSKESAPLSKRGAKEEGWKDLRNNIRHHFPRNKNFFIVTGFEGSAFDKIAGTSFFKSIKAGPGLNGIVQHVTATNGVSLGGIEGAYKKFIGDIKNSKTKKSKIKNSEPETRGCCIILQFNGEVHKTDDKGHDEDFEVQLDEVGWTPISKIFKIFKDNSEEYRLSILVVSKNGHHATKCLIGRKYHKDGSNNVGRSRNLLPEDSIVATTEDYSFNEKDVRTWLNELKLEHKWQKGVSILDLLNTYLIQSKWDEMKPQLSVLENGDVWQYDTQKLLKGKLAKANAVKQETVELVTNSYKINGMDLVAQQIEKHEHTYHWQGGLPLAYRAPASVLTLMGRLIDAYGSPQKKLSHRHRIKKGMSGLLKFGKSKSKKPPVDPTPQHQHNR